MSLKFYKTDVEKKYVLKLFLCLLLYLNDIFWNYLILDQGHTYGVLTNENYLPVSYLFWICVFMKKTLIDTLERKYEVSQRHSDFCPIVFINWAVLWSINGAPQDKYWFLFRCGQWISWIVDYLDCFIGCGIRTCNAVE